MSDAFGYAELRQDVAEVIEEAGQVGAIRRPGASSGDAWNPTFAAPTDTPCTLVELESTAAEIDGTLIRSSDRKVMVSTHGVPDAPTQADQIVIGGKPLAIVSVMPLSPGGVVLLWQVQARG